jgi:UTP--glucose-1-phosphate uridylyltransferase
MTVRKAVIPAAGLGTRFLPATKSQPKEMIPVIDKPGIQYVVEEAVASGLDDILVITDRGKAAMEDHFDRSLELEHHLTAAGKEEQLAEVRAIADLTDVHYVRQKEPLGFGDAVARARAHVGNSPFVVMVADEIVPEPPPGERSLIDSMIDFYEQKAASVITVQEVPEEDVSAYGVIAPDPAEGELVRVLDMIEKPGPGEAPSRLASRGRYLFQPEIFDALDRTSPGYGGEIQLTDAIRLLAKEQPVYAFVYKGQCLDVGKKMDYLRTVIELALRRDDLGKQFAEYLRDLTSRLEE